MNSKNEILDTLSSSCGTSIITLLPCDYELSDDDNYGNVSQDSIDSSELVDSCEDENEFIKIEEIFSLNKGLTKTEEIKVKSGQIICA